MTSQHYLSQPGDLMKLPASFTPTDFIRKTNEDYITWCKITYTPEFCAQGPNLYGLWAWQEQQRRMDALKAFPEVARKALRLALDTLEANIDWHVDNDDAGTYTGSVLDEQNEKAGAALSVALNYL